MKVRTKNQRVDVSLTTPTIGSKGDLCDRSLAGDCDIDYILKKYGANFVVPPQLEDIDLTALPLDPVDRINAAIGVLGAAEQAKADLEKEKPSEEKPLELEKPVEAVKPVESEENKNG